jgi:glutathione synthase/RimK-type ligase-like ATP-grasp enzyme
VDSSVAFITSRRDPKIMPDDQSLAQALETRGYAVSPVPWGSDLSGYSLSVFRSCSDYPEDIVAFSSWLDEIETSNFPVLNSPEVVRDNADKGYLVKLSARGLPTIPTVRLAPGEELASPDLMGLFPGQPVVIKPAVATRGMHAVLASSLEDARSGTEMLKTQPMLVQPYMPEIREGEISFVFFNGEFSHAVVKTPAAHDFRVQPRHGGSRSPYNPDMGLVREALHILKHAVPVMPCYARVDGLVHKKKLLLMELELIEPCVFLSSCRHAADRFGEAVHAAVATRPHLREVERYDRARNLTP